jgi:amino-acid N-acetyltransferase
MLLSIMSIVPATAEDLGPIQGLLNGQGLPSADIEAHSLRTFLVLRDERQISGVVGLDPLGPVAMLRSLVVSETRRHGGLGSRMLAAAEDLAARLGVTDLYLLTTDAERYFAARGYRTIDRSEAPAGIRLHPQFRGLCPSTSILMTKAMTFEAFDSMALQQRAREIGQQ